METVTLTAPSALRTKLRLALTLLDEVRALRKLHAEVNLNPTAVNRGRLKRAENKLDTSLVTMARLVTEADLVEVGSLVIKRVPAVSIDVSTD